MSLIGSVKSNGDSFIRPPKELQYPLKEPPKCITYPTKQHPLSLEIYSACVDNDIHRLKHLLLNFSDTNDHIDFMLENKRTGLMWAAFCGYPDQVKWFIEIGADLNLQHPITMKSALHFASERGHLEVVKILLDKGANDDVKDFEGKSIDDIAINDSIREFLKNYRKLKAFDMLMESESSSDEDE